MGRCRPASHPASHPTISTTTLPCVGDDSPTPTGVPGRASQAHVQQLLQAGGTTWGAQGGKGEEHRRASERIGEEERRLREREARVMGGADRVAEGRTEGPGRPQGEEAQAVEELQRAWADLRRRQERVDRAEREGGRHGEGGGPEGRPPLMPFRQLAIPLEQESEMQERAWRRIRGEAARLAERDREVAARERRVREKQSAVARGAHRVLPDQEGTPPPRMWRGGCPPGKGPERRKGRLGRRGGSGGGLRSGEQGEQRGRRGLPAPARSRRRRTGARSCHRRGGMRHRRYGGVPRRSRGGRRGTCRSWSPT